MRVVAVLIGALVLAGPASAAPPRAGIVVPGKSLGGLQLGGTTAAVRAAWGARHGTCRGCRLPTWYFNYESGEPQGAGVELRSGRVVGLFTVWAPPGWRIRNGVGIGDAPPPRGIRVSCGTYYALTTRTRATVTAVYVHDGVVWGFGLSRPSVPVCR